MPSETMMQRLKLLWTELKPLSPSSAFLTLVLIPLSAYFPSSLICHFPLGVRADSGVLPEWKASLCREPEQRWRLYTWCGAQEDHDGSRWFWEHQEAQTVHAPTVPQGVCVFSIFVYLWVNEKRTASQLELLRPLAKSSWKSLTIICERLNLKCVETYVKTFFLYVCFSLIVQVNLYALKTLRYNYQKIGLLISHFSFSAAGFLVLEPEFNLKNILFMSLQWQKNIQV